MIKFIFKNLKKIIVAFIFITALFFLTFNENGILKYYHLKNEVKKLDQEINQVDSENKELQNGIDSLQKKIPAKVEKTAREKYGMIKKGETSIEIKQK